jgi:hypothetical protein
MLHQVPFCVMRIPKCVRFIQIYWKNVLFNNLKHSNVIYERPSGCVHNRYRKIHRTQQKVIYCYRATDCDQLWVSIRQRLIKNENDRYMKIRVPYRTASVHSELQHTRWQVTCGTELLCRHCTATGISDGQYVVKYCKGRAVCEVECGVLTGIFGYVLCYLKYNPHRFYTPLSP